MWKGWPEFLKEFLRKFDLCERCLGDSKFPFTGKSELVCSFDVHRRASNAPLWQILCISARSACVALLTIIYFKMASKLESSLQMHCIPIHVQGNMKALIVILKISIYPSQKASRHPLNAKLEKLCGLDIWILKLIEDENWLIGEWYFCTLVTTFRKTENFRFLCDNVWISF